MRTEQPELPTYGPRQHESGKLWLSTCHCDRRSRRDGHDGQVPLPARAPPYLPCSRFELPADVLALCASGEGVTPIWPKPAAGQRCPCRCGSVATDRRSRRLPPADHRVGRHRRASDELGAEGSLEPEGDEAGLAPVAVVDDVEPGPGLLCDDPANFTPTRRIGSDRRSTGLPGDQLPQRQGPGQTAR